MRGSPQKTEAAPGGGGEAGEGMAGKEISPKLEPRTDVRKREGLVGAEGRPSGPLGRALGWEGGSWVTLGKPPSSGLLLRTLGMVV